MDAGLQTIGVAVVNLAQVALDISEQPNESTRLLQWLSRLPGMGWGLAVFSLIGVAIAAIAKLTGNLDKILSFKSKYLSKTSSEPSERQLAHLRQSLLKQMRTDVSVRLEDSLHNLVRVDLEREEQRHQVGRRQPTLVGTKEEKISGFKNLIQRGLRVFSSGQMTEPLSPTEKTYNIFHRNDVGERLLILGEPGAGKTTELLVVAQHLVNIAIEDGDKPIPLIFELSNWEPGVPISSWVGKRLQKTYGVSPKLAKPLAQRWIQQNQLILLLDGLDELGHRNQVACIEALEIFLSKHQALSTIVCCRREEYEQGGQQLRQLKGAVYLQAIRAQQIQQYLKDLKREQLWASLQFKPELIKLIQSPLFLTMLAVAYQGQPIQDREALFNAYVQKQLHEPSHNGTYEPGKETKPERTVHYLVWLAKQLKKRRETEFLIESLQPDCLASWRERVVYRLATGLITGIVAGLSSGLIVVLSAILVIVFFGVIMRSSESGDSLSVSLFNMLDLVLISGICGGLGSGLNAALNRIEPQEQLKWSLRRALSGAVAYALASGTSLALITGLTVLFRTGDLQFSLYLALASGLSAALLSGLLAGLLAGFRSETIKQKQVPNQGIRKSLSNGLSVGGFFGLSLGVFFGLFFALMGVFFGNSNFALVGGLLGGPIFGLVGWVSLGIIGGLKAGHSSAIQHLILRICLSANGYAPWNYERFLRHAVRHRFIQRTGGRYRFVHDLLREHFAQMTPQQQKVIAQKPCPDSIECES